MYMSCAYVHLIVVLTCVLSYTTFSKDTLRLREKSCPSTVIIYCGGCVTWYITGNCLIKRLCDFIVVLHEYTPCHISHRI